MLFLFIKGKEENFLVTKKLWDNKERFSKSGQEIMLNSSLSNEQKDKLLANLFLNLS